MYQETRLLELYHELITDTWEPLPATVFVIKHPKPREVWASNFRDRIVHHLLYNKIGEQFERTFHVNSCACIKGRGTLYATNRLGKILRSQTENFSKATYVLQSDIRSFFVSIDRNILFDLLKRKVTDSLLLSIIAKVVFQDVTKGAIINSHPSEMALIPDHKSLFHSGDRGLPIGNLSSQFFANVYLNVLDQFVQHEIKLPFIRYVDDFILFSRSKEPLYAALEGIKKLVETLNLELAHSKTTITRFDRDVGKIDFVGNVHYPFHIQQRPSTLDTALERIAEVDDAHLTINSYLGLLRHHGAFCQRKCIGQVAMSKGHAVMADYSKAFRAR